MSELVRAALAAVGDGRRLTMAEARGAMMNALGALSKRVRAH